ncbi:MAG: zf-HC2 domain-containing protein [Lachnospiraceae bacterium]|nr:zf-HC2 domain-containing protein [Lachnospiraceae bacterium]
MECKQIKSMVNDYIEGNMTDEECEAFIRHVRQCDSCYEELETYFTIDRVLSYLEEGEDPDSQSYSMRKLLLEDLKENENRIRFSRIERVLFYVSVAAAEAVLAAMALMELIPELLPMLTESVRNITGGF